MARTRGGQARRINNLKTEGLLSAKEIANACRRNSRFKIKFLLLKVLRNVVR